MAMMVMMIMTSSLWILHQKTILLRMMIFTIAMTKNIFPIARMMNLTMSLKVVDNRKISKRAVTNFFLFLAKLLMAAKSHQSPLLMSSSKWSPLFKLAVWQKTTLKWWWACVTWHYNLLVKNIDFPRRHLRLAIITNLKRDLVLAWCLALFASSAARYFHQTRLSDCAMLAKPNYSKHLRTCQEKCTCITRSPLPWRVF